RVGRARRPSGRSSPPRFQPTPRRQHRSSTADDDGGSPTARRSSACVALTACVGLFVLYDDARYIFDGITTRGLPFVILSAVGGLGSLWLLRNRSTRGGGVR